LIESISVASNSRVVHDAVATFATAVNAREALVTQRADTSLQPKEVLL
jgi:hypothetical protein